MPLTGQSLTDMGKILNRSTSYLRRLQKRFDLPVCKGSGYSQSYLQFLRTVIGLRTLHVEEDVLLQLWHIEKKLLQLLHADSTGSSSWFIDSCGSTGKRTHRLLLSNFDMGVYLPSGTVQLGLPFSDTLTELFTASEMGEDVLLLLGDYLKVYDRIRNSVKAETPLLYFALNLATRQW